MVDIEVDIEIWCATCGAGLCNATSADRRHGRPAFQVEACQRCMDAAEERGREEGYLEGVNDTERAHA